MQLLRYVGPVRQAARHEQRYPSWLCVIRVLPNAWLILGAQLPAGGRRACSPEEGLRATGAECSTAGDGYSRGNNVIVLWCGVQRDPQELFDLGINLFNTGEFYKCHEVLEQIWTSVEQPERWFLQSLIHFSVGFYHLQHDNVIGASRQLEKGLRKIQGYLPEWGGVRTARIEQEARRSLAIIEAGRKIDNYPTIEQFAPYRPRANTGA
jgi:uncharacterized protein